MSAAPHKHQLNLPPSEVNKVGNAPSNHQKVAHAQLSSATSEAGRLIDQARERAGLTRKEACALMLIDESRYSKWVSGAAPNDTPSFPRLLLLPPTFWFHMNQLLNERYGLRRLIVSQLLNATADLALAVER